MDKNFNLKEYKNITKDQLDEMLELIGLSHDEFIDELKEYAEKSEEDLNKIIDDLEKEDVKESLVSHIGIINEAKYNKSAKTIAKDLAITGVINATATPLGAILYVWSRKNYKKNVENAMLYLEHKKQHTKDAKEKAKIENELSILGSAHFDNDGRFRGFAGSAAQIIKMKSQHKGDLQFEEALKNTKTNSKEYKKEGSKLRKEMAPNQLNDVIYKVRVGYGGKNSSIKDEDGNEVKQEVVKDPKTGEKKKVITHTGPRGGKFYYPEGKPKNAENRVYVTKESIDNSLVSFLLYS